MPSVHLPHGASLAVNYKVAQCHAFKLEHAQSNGSVEVYIILILIPLLKGKFSVPPHYIFPVYIGEI